jgi:hypothetical protein
VPALAPCDVCANNGVVAAAALLLLSSSQVHMVTLLAGQGALKHLLTEGDKVRRFLRATPRETASGHALFVVRLRSSHAHRKSRSNGNILGL